MRHRISTRSTRSSKLPLKSQRVRVTGKFPPRGQTLVLEWYSLHKAELAEDWSLAQSKQLRISHPSSSANILRLRSSGQPQAPRASTPDQAGKFLNDEIAK